MQDSQEVLHRINGINKWWAEHPRSKIKIVTVDVHDYLSGDHDGLAQEASIVIPQDPGRALVKEAVSLLLRHQYISFEPKQPPIHKCDEGTGMGLPHSGEVADNAFLLLLRWHGLELELFKTVLKS